MTDPTLADISSEAFIFLGAGAAVLRQMARPGVGLGVAKHSRTLQDPMGRLHGTMSYIYVLSLGTAKERRSMARLVNKAHVPVRSDQYNAFDPELQRWVAATLYQGALELQQLFRGELGPHEHERLYQAAAIYGTTLQMPEELWPTDRDAFARYWNGSLGSFEVSDKVREYAHALLAGGAAPWYIKPLLPLQRLATGALLGPELRAKYHLGWSQAEQRRWDLFARYFPVFYRMLPAFVRRLPARLYLRSWRKRYGTPSQS